MRRDASSQSVVVQLLVGLLRVNRLAVFLVGIRHWEYKQWVHCLHKWVARKMPKSKHDELTQRIHYISVTHAVLVRVVTSEYPYCIAFDADAAHIHLWSTSRLSTPIVCEATVWRTVDCSDVTNRIIIIIIIICSDLSIGFASVAPILPPRKAETICSILCFAFLRSFHFEDKSLSCVWLDAHRTFMASSRFSVKIFLFCAFAL